MDEWLLYEHEDGRHAVASSAEAATFVHGDPAWHRVGPVEVPEASPREVVAYHDKDQPNGIAWCPGYPDKLPDIVPLYAGERTSKNLRGALARGVKGHGDAEG